MNWSKKKRKENSSSLWFTDRLFQPFIVEPAIDAPNDDLVSDSSDDETTRKSLWPSLPVATFCSIALTILGCTTSVFEVLSSHHPVAIATVAVWATILALLLASRPRIGSVAIAALYISTIALETLAVFQTTASLDLRTISLLKVVGLTAALIAFIIVLNMPLRHPFLSRNGISPPYSVPASDLRSPEDNLTLWQWASVAWLAPLIKIGNERQLQESDVWFLGYEFQHSHLHEAFKSLSGTVVRRLLKANWVDLVILTLLAIVELLATLSAPLILQQLLKAMEVVLTHKTPAITYAAMMLFLRAIAAQSSVFSLWFARRSYERARGEMITMLHDKVLHRKDIGGTPEKVEKEEENMDLATSVDDQDIENDNEWGSEADGLLSGKQISKESSLRKTLSTLGKAFSCFTSRKVEAANKEKQPASMGKILNLMRNDVYEVAQRFWEFQMLINKPLGLILSTILVWRLLGWSCMIGIGVVVVTQIINVILARILVKWETVRRKATDGRIQQVSQYIEAIRHLRWYGWHVKMLDRVMTARQKELNMRIMTTLWNFVIGTVNTLGSDTVPVAAFWAYTTIAGKPLRVDVAFPALQLFTMLQENLKEIPNLITILLNAVVAVGRIEDFMSEPELTYTNDAKFEDRLAVEDGTFAWPGVAEPVLKHINVDFPVGLTIISGPVAAGKTALLQSLLGELDQHGGTLIRPDVGIAYCAQNPWLQSMSIKENILFGSPFNSDHYTRVLDACALRPDLATFPHADQSPIGENGIGLSGGQKARVAMARALYSQAKFVLLDDPLSALDQQTAEWIVRECFTSDLLANRTIALVTHRIDLCDGIAKQIVELSEGTVTTRQGSNVGKAETAEFSKASVASTSATPSDQMLEAPEQFEDVEFREDGGIRLKVYWAYLKAGELKWWSLVLLACALSRVVDYSQTWFLKEWGDAYSEVQEFPALLLHGFGQIIHSSSTPISKLFERFPDPSENVQPWLLGYLVLILVANAMYLVARLFMLVLTYKAGKNLFRSTMIAISDATFHYYDVTPVGRLMNRVTSDIGTVDGNLAYQILTVMWFSVSWIGSVLVIATITPVFLLFSILITAAFTYYFTRFLPTSQSLRRLETVSLSPLMSNFGALLNGLTTVRAFNVQEQFQNRVISVTDKFQGMDHFYWSLQGWLAYRFELLSATSFFVLALLAIYSGLEAGLTGFILIIAERFVQATHWLCKQYGALQLEFVSVERVVELVHLEQEDPGSINPPASWPSSSGSVIFENVDIRYAPHLDPALKNITLTIPGGSTTAIIGRTGSGKSTLALSLLGTIAPTSGRILIDNVDLSLVSKQALRSRITFLAQEPILFPGTLSTNLDPLLTHSESERASVLARIGGAKYNWTLSTPIDVGGKNLSQGQRQLVGLARALLRRSSVVIMDEATASIDLETSREVQRVLREELKGATVITIAHRAEAVEGVDHVVELSRGELVRFGPA